MESVIESLESAVDGIEWLQGSNWSAEYIAEKLGDIKDMIIGAREEAKHWSAVLQMQGVEVDP